VEDRRDLEDLRLWRGDLVVDRRHRAAAVGERVVGREEPLLDERLEVTTEAATVWMHAGDGRDRDDGDLGTAVLEQPRGVEDPLLGR